MSASAIAMNRFGLGARRGQAAPADPKAWLLGQIDSFEPRPSAIAALPTTAEVARPYSVYLSLLRATHGISRADRMSDARARDAVSTLMQREEASDSTASMAGAMKAERAGAKIDPVARSRETSRRQAQEHYALAVAARAQAALTSPAPFAERLVHFWANHFAVSIDRMPLIGLASQLEFDAIRPHLTGTFGSMLHAVERHPAMLLYLDQANSIGPMSLASGMASRRGRRSNAGLNENLAREILELHTLGVRSGYNQADVTEFARALTGWTVVGLADVRVAGHMDAGGEPGTFAFASDLHEPGSRRVLGRTFAPQGEQQAAGVLEMLATHPSTATYIATKLARHFAGDNPPPSLVAALETSFNETGGDLPSLYRALIDAPECWVEQPVKFKSPWEWCVSSLAALGTFEPDVQEVDFVLKQLGQRVWSPGSPAGWADLDAAWLAPDAVFRRVEAAQRLVKIASAPGDVHKLARELFPGALSQSTQQTIARASSPAQGLSLLLVAPESMRR